MLSQQPVDIQQEHFDWALMQSSSTTIGIIMQSQLQQVGIPKQLDGNCDNANFKS
jgi:hypothetical protein